MPGGGTRQVIIRHAHVRHELSEITAFYAAHSRVHMPQPEIDSLCRAAEDGRLYVAELDRSGGGRELVALAGLFPLAETGDEESALPVLELAGMALNGSVIGGLAPHTLQDVLVWVRLCGLMVEGGGAPLCVISSVVNANQKSVDSMQRCGLVPFDPPAWLKDNHRSWIGGGADNPLTDFVFQPSAAPSVAMNLRQAMKPAKLSRTNKISRKAEEFTLRFDLGWSRRNYPLLKAVEKGEYDLPWLATVPNQRRIDLGDGETIIYSGEPPGKR